MDQDANIDGRGLGFVFSAVKGVMMHFGKAGEFAKVLSLCALALGSSAEYAHASTTVQTTFAVGATVLSGCLVVATDLVFGNYVNSSTTPTDTSNTVIATCTSGVVYSIAAGAGNGTGATVAARSMTGIVGGNSLNYLLYKDSTHSTLWGDGTLGTSTFGGTAGLLPTTYTAYGRIPITQQASAGVYADSVTVTLTF